MSSVAELATALQTVFTTIADRAARETKCVIRQRAFSGASLCQTLVFGWLATPTASLTDLVRMAASAGVTVSNQAVEQRFTVTCAAMLKQVLEAAVTQVLTADPVAIPVLQRFRGVYLRDCTVVGLPAALASTWHGCGGRGDTSEAALKLSVQLNLTDGSVDGPLLAAGRVHDTVVGDGHRALPAGSLVLTDLGYFGLDRLAAWDALGVYYLLRARAGTVVRLADEPTGQCWDIPDLLATRCGSTVDLAVLLGAKKRLPCRLLAVRVPQEVAAQRRAKIRAEAKGKTPSRVKLAMADWTVLVTNAPAEQLTIAEALVLARARWQIELLFKLWKSSGRLSVSRSAQPQWILCELYAKLLGVLVQQWLLLTSSWAMPNRSLFKAAAVVRDGAKGIVKALRRGRGLHAVLRDLREDVAACPPMNTRKTHPNTYQRLLNPSLGGQT